MRAYLAATAIIIGLLGTYLALLPLAIWGVGVSPRSLSLLGTAPRFELMLAKLVRTSGDFA